MKYIMKVELGIPILVNGKEYVVKDIDLSSHGQLCLLAGDIDGKQEVTIKTEIRQAITLGDTLQRLITFLTNTY